jgi:hypothetical protein
MLTREQALNWNQEWSYTDRDFIEQNFNRLDPRTFYVPPSGGYVRCIDVQGTTVMTLHPGYLKFKRELVPAERVEPDWPGVTLSTFRPHASPLEAPGEGELVCPIHQITLPLTGICDECQ